jgi:hypothetical protein
VMLCIVNARSLCTYVQYWLHFLWFERL